ncbi:MAG: biotin/lipoyl-binding protein [Oscillospiraceae bacterium]|nr:biotin/lipoyl-binding protein [Oscillospiraceae bacterium]
MKKQNKKKIIITVTAVVLVVAIGLGVWFGVSRGRSEPVKVFAFNSVGMTEYWGDSQESYGPVSTDKIQTVFLSSTQTVTEMKVAQGDEVKKGDVLMTFDTTLSDLQLERKRLEVEKLKLDLETAQKKLKDIRNMKPMSIVSSDDFDYGGENGGANRPLEGNYELSDKQFYDGKDEETALICWLRNGYTVNDSILEKARQLAEDLQTKNQPDPTEPDTEPTTEPTTEPPTQPSTEPPTQPSTEPPTQPSTEPPTQPSTEASTPSTEESSEGEDGEQSSASAAENPGEKPTVSVEDYYIVFKVTKDDMSMGNRLAWEGLHVFKQGSGFAFNFFDASGVPDHTITTDDPDNPDEPDDPDIPDPGSGYTAAQLAQMRAEQEKTIKETKFKIKMAEADYKIMQTEMSDGNVYAEFDGKVVSVLTEEEAKTQNQPVLKVSGGGGFYIQGSVSELEKDKMQIGQEVTVNDWNTGMTYTGKIVSMGDFPTNSDGWNGSGNPNVSYYPFTVFVDETADLQAGMYVNIQYSSAESENGIYLENPFIRTENGQSYVYVQGASGKLEKRFVTTGKALWGSYTEIRSGLTVDDLIAFPYGKNLKEGAPTVESDVSDLYSY